MSREEQVKELEQLLKTLKCLTANSKIYNLEYYVADILHSAGYKKYTPNDEQEDYKDAYEDGYDDGVQDFAKELKNRAFQGYQVGMFIVSTEMIDELLKEFYEV